MILAIIVQPCYIPIKITKKKSAKVEGISDGLKTRPEGRGIFCTFCVLSHCL